MTKHTLKMTSAALAVATLASLVACATLSAKGRLRWQQLSMIVIIGFVVGGHDSNKAQASVVVCEIYDC